MFVNMLLNLWKKYRIHLIVTSFLVWLIFLDRNNLIDLIKYKQELADLVKKEAYYLSEIEKMKADKKLIFSSKESLETFAREKYLMKRENEDIFIIQEK